MAQASRDQNRVPTLLGVSTVDGTTPIAVKVDPVTGELQTSATLTGSGGDGAILDGVSSSIKASVLDLSNNNPLTVAIVDGSGDQITSFGGGTQYTEDAAAAANPVGTALNLIRADSLAGITTTDGDNVAARGTDKGELYVKHVDTIAVTDNSGSLTVDNGGTFAVQAAQSGTWNVGTLTTITNVVHVDDNSSTLSIDDGSGSITVDGTITASSTTGNVAHDGVDSGNPVKIGGYAKAAAPTDVSADGDRVNAWFDLAGRLQVGDGGGNLSIDDGGNTITVDGTVAVTNAGLTELAAAINASSQMDVNIAASNATITVASHAVTNAGTFAVQVDGSALTALQLIDDPVATLGTTTYTETTTKGMIIGAVRRDADTTLVDTTNEVGPVQMNAAGQLKVEVFSGETLPVSLTSTTVTGTVAVTQSGTWDEVGINDSGNSITVDNGGTFAVQVDGAALTSLQLADDVVYTDDTSTHSTGSSKGTLFMAAATPTDSAVNANDIGAVAMTTDRKLHVAVMDALPAGTNGIGKLTANSGVTIGAVEIAASQTLSTVTTVSTVTGGGVAHDGGDSGNPIKIGLKAETSPKGITTVADGDRTDWYADADGIAMVKLNTSYADIISERVTDTGGTSTAFTNFSAVASTKNYVTSITVYNSSSTAGYVDFRSGTAGSILWTMPLPATSGSVISSAVPLFATAANTALAYDVSGALSTVYISVSGFQSKL